MLLPTVNSALRRSLESWFKERGIRPQVLGDFDDNGLMLEFGRETGVCAVPSAIAKEIVRGHGLKAIGRTDDVAEKIFLISTERKLRNPAAIAIAAAAGRAE
jgi:LysR family transcriptional activator of nhaA